MEEVHTKNLYPALSANKKDKCVKLTSFFLFIQDKVACPKFGHPSLHSYAKDLALNTEFVAAVGMLRKKNQKVGTLHN